MICSKCSHEMKQCVGFTQVGWDCVNPDCGKHNTSDSVVGIMSLQDFTQVAIDYIKEPNKNKWYNFDFKHDCDFAQGRELENLAINCGLVRMEEREAANGFGGTKEETDVELRARIELFGHCI